jgi:hypothetical protein
MPVSNLQVLTRKVGFNKDSKAYSCHLFPAGNSERASDQKHEESSGPAIHSRDTPNPDPHISRILGLRNRCSSLHAKLCVGPQICCYHRKRCCLLANDRLPTCKTIINLTDISGTLTKTSC